MESRTDIMREFEQVETGNVADAMSKLGLPSGAIMGLHVLFPMKKSACGRAITIHQQEKEHADAAKAQQRKVITTMTQPGDTVVIDAEGCLSAATAGWLLAMSAKKRGVKGFVVNGCLRDISEFVQAEFPVHLLGSSPVGSRGTLETVGINVEVTFGNVTICPGDYILQDATGCIVIPAEQAEKVLSVAKIISRQEKECEVCLAQGMDFQVARQHGMDKYPLKL